MTLIDIDERRRTLHELQIPRGIAKAILEAAPNPFVALDVEFRSKIAHESFYRLFRTTKEISRERSRTQLVLRPDDLAELRTALDSVALNGGELKSYTINVSLPGSGPKMLTVDALRIVLEEKSRPLVLFSFVTS